MVKNIKPEDLQKMQTYGRLVASKDDQGALECAAEYLAISRLEGSNFKQLWIFFEEGARNKADGQYHMDAIKSRLFERAEELFS